MEKKDPLWLKIIIWFLIVCFIVFAIYIIMVLIDNGTLMSVIIFAIICLILKNL